MRVAERFDANIVMKPGARRPNWHESTSPYGYVIGEAISAMGKEIRRENLYEAVFWAHQVAISGSAAEDFLWERLRVVAVEDCGPANPIALVAVDSAFRLYMDLPAHWDERFQVVSYAVACLCDSEKTHLSNAIFSEMVCRLRDDGQRLSIPDYALDLHTRKGKSLGRDWLQFLEVGWKLARESARFPSVWAEALLARARENSSQQ